MKPFLTCALVVLLAATHSRADHLSFHPGSENQVQRDGPGHQADLSRQQQLKRVVFFVTGKWPDRSVFSRTQDDNYIGDEPVESFLDGPSHDPHQQGGPEVEFRLGDHHIVQEEVGSSQNSVEGITGHRDGPISPKSSGQVADISLDQIADFHAVQEDDGSSPKVAEGITGYADGPIGQVADSSLDEIADFILALVNKMILAKGEDQIPVPNMSEEFEKRVGFIKLHGKFDAQNGWFRNLSTIRRTGDVVASRRGVDALVLTCELGLAVMQFGFDSYQANLAGLSVRGRMTGSVGSNSVTVQVATSYDGGKCNVTLERLTVDRFDGVDVELTGLGDLSWLLDSIAGWATKHFKDQIVSGIEENFKKAVSAVMAKYHCSELVHRVEHLQRRKTDQEISL